MVFCVLCTDGFFVNCWYCVGILVFCCWFVSFVLLYMIGVLCIVIRCILCSIFSAWLAVYVCFALYMFVVLHCNLLYDCPKLYFMLYLCVACLVYFVFCNVVFCIFANYHILLNFLCRVVFCIILMIMVFWFLFVAFGGCILLCFQYWYRVYLGLCCVDCLYVVFCILCTLIQ